MKNKRGRPPLDPSGAPSVHVNLKVNKKLYDAIYAGARQDRTSMAAWVRKKIDLEIQRQTDTE